LPTFEKTDSFRRDYDGLTREQKAAVRRAVKEFVEDLAAARPFRRGLRVKGVQGATGIFEMSWASDGRATFEFGDQLSQGDPHIIWRRIGTHEIFKGP
jgi:hypothetical protein